MAGLPEQAQWENEIYQIEQTDPVVGGAPDLAQGHGITNVPHQELANRTVWLKAQVDALNAATAALDQYATDVELATAIAGFVTQAEIDTAINNLINGAPAALDTLKELSDALSNSDSAIAALTTQIAGKLDIAAYTAADILAKLKTVDGSGSGLDADLLDGLSSESFARSWRTFSAGTGLTGGGDLSGDRTISASIPSQAEAEAGAINNKLMTPLRARQAISALRGGVLHVEDRRASGTPPQSFVGNAWTRRDLNAVIMNDISGASVAGNQITLPAGTFDIEGSVPAKRCNGSKARFRNITSGSTALVSSTVSDHSSYGGVSNAEFFGRITLSAQAVFEVQQFNVSNVGGGYSGGHEFAATGEVEIYTQLRIKEVL